MEREINKEKINDYINVLSSLLGLDPNKKDDKRIIDFLKNSVYYRADLYKNIKIPANVDGFKDYIIKPKNGYWTIEEFLLNRLMVGLRKINIDGTLEGTSAEYVAHSCDLDFNFDYCMSIAKVFFDTELEAKISTYKTFVHEIGHCLKTEYSGSYKVFASKAKNDFYLKLLEELKKFNSGKYANDVVDRLSDNDETLEVVHTGVRLKKGYATDNKMYLLSNIDEMLNEDESLAITNANGKIKNYKWNRIYEDDGITKSGYYIESPNISSGYNKYYGIGIQLKHLIGKANYFQIQYVNPDKTIEILDKYFADVCREFCNKRGENYKSLFRQLNDELYHISQKGRSYSSFLKLNELLAYCYEKRLIEYFNNNEFVPEHILDTMLNEIDSMMKYSTRNVDKNIDNNLKHLQKYRELKNIVLSKKMIFMLDRFADEREDPQKYTSNYNELVSLSNEITHPQLKAYFNKMFSAIVKSNYDEYQMLKSSINMIKNRN